VKKTKKPVTEQFAVEFADNRLAAMLSGPHQKNFARLEQRLDIRITERGNRVALSGAERERGATILQALYARAEAGESITLAEVDAELRFTDGSRAATPGAIRTASGRLTRPRSPAQSAYIDLMRDQPLVFGIGPAGTGKTYLAAAYGARLCNIGRGSEHHRRPDENGPDPARRGFPDGCDRRSGPERLPGGRPEGLLEALSILEGVEGVGIQRFSDADVVRYALVSRIVRAYTAKGR